MRRPDFEAVYEKGFRLSGPYFAAVCLKVEGSERAKVGFAVPKALGGSVARNRIRRRLREAVRVNLARLGSGWAVVFQVRRATGQAPFADLTREVEKLFARCARS